MSQSRPTGPSVWIGLIFWLAITFTAAWIGSWFQPGEWYAGLVKPSWTPPGWLFGPVWTLLYIMMAVAAWLVWRCQAGQTAKRMALVAFVVQLALNAIWSWAFFAARSPGLGLVVIIGLLAAIIWTAMAFFRVSRPAGILMLPYLAWVAYATTLNAGIFVMNS